MKKIYIITLAILVSMGLGVSTNKVLSQTYTQTVSTAQQTVYQQVNPLDIVANPSKYLKKDIRITAKFDKFSTLGLDYPPAMRSQEKYISFLIQRPDVLDHNVPLSELKIFLTKELAEKNVSLDAGDQIEFTGTVFSNALGDAWIDVNSLKVINKVKKADKK